MFGDLPYRVLEGNALTVLRSLPGEYVQTCVTSPPYWGLRDYGTEPLVWGGDAACSHEWTEADSSCLRCGAWRGQLGLEPTPEMYVEHLVDIFREVRRVLRDDGTLWLNVGDCYASSGRTNRTLTGPPSLSEGGKPTATKRPDGCKPKDLVGIPWMLAFALRNDGWWLRAEVVWHKTSTTPESVRDRPTRAHEQIFLLAKSQRYFYNATAARSPFADARMGRDGGRKPSQRNRGGRTDGFTKPNGIDPSANGGSNWRDVWTIGPEPVREEHYAAFPRELPRRCILAGSRPGDVVLDPFCGSGRTGEAALDTGRRFVGIELSGRYAAIALRRLAAAAGCGTREVRDVVEQGRQVPLLIGDGGDGNGS